MYNLQKKNKNKMTQNTHFNKVNEPLFIKTIY